jgi:hypothetical protein
LGFYISLNLSITYPMRIKPLLIACACLTQALVSVAQSGTIITVAGIDSFGYNGDNRPAITAKLNAPESICQDKYGNIFVADAANHRIRKVNAITGLITTVAGKDSSGYSGDNGPATNAKLFGPEGVAVDSNNNLYIGDALNYRIRKVNAITGIITTIAGTGVAGAFGNGIPAINAQLNGPIHLHIDSFQNLYVIDYGNYLVRKIASSTGLITTVAGNGICSNSVDGLVATAAALNKPIRVFADDTGNIYLSEELGHKVRKVSAATGLLSTVAGTGLAGSTGDSGPATAAELALPTGIYVDKNGNIFIAEYDNGAIRRVDASTGIITTVAGTLGSPGFAGDNGPATSAQMTAMDLTFDKDGNIYIADRGNQRIRKVCYDTTCLKIPTDTANHTGIINTITTTQHYQLTPNPSNGDILLTQGEADNDAVTIDVRDIVGKSVYMSAARFRDRTYHLSLEHLSPGLYFMRIRDSKERVWNVRFVVE